MFVGIDEITSSCMHRAEVMHLWLLALRTLMTNVQIPLGPMQMGFSPDYLAEQLTPYPLPTKDGGMLRTIGDARAYMLALSKEREWRDHWKEAYRLLVVGGGAAALTRQVHLALSRDGQLDVGAFEHMTGDETGN
jgi:hypothetical protein